jgi:hypothetical protein
MRDLAGTDKLRQACFELARINKRSPRPVDADQIVRLAERYTVIALSFVSGSLKIDVPLITRAIIYLTQAHGGPMEQESLDWFQYTLSTLLEAARPYASLDKEGLSFVEDMLDGNYRSLNRKADLMR